MNWSARDYQAFAIPFIIGGTVCLYGAVSDYGKFFSHSDVYLFFSFILYGMAVIAFLRARAVNQQNGKQK